MKLIFPSTLIIYNSEISVENYISQICSDLKHVLNSNNPDIFQINENTGWTIEAVRQIKSFLSKKPFNHDSKIIIIKLAENLNIESQNALLKNLEEPGEGNYIILTTKKPSGLLQTINSRCHLINIKEKDTNYSSLIIPEVDIVKNLLKSEELSKNKDEVKNIIQEQITLYQNLLLKEPNQKNSSTLKKLIKCSEMINSNVDPKSVFDYFFLTQ